MATDVTNTFTITIASGVTPPTVEAGGPYSGDVDTAIQLAATVTPGSDASPVLTWSIDSGGTGTFLPNANAEDPTFTPDDVDSYVLRFSVDPDDGAPVEDTATLESNAPSVKTEEMYINNTGTFVKHTPNVLVSGTFQEVDAYVIEGGAWVQVHEK